MKRIFLFLAMPFFITSICPMEAVKRKGSLILFGSSTPNSQQVEAQFQLREKWMKAQDYAVEQALDKAANNQALQTIIKDQKDGQKYLLEIQTIYDDSKKKIIGISLYYNFKRKTPSDPQEYENSDIIFLAHTKQKSIACKN